jgi:hypothetical protein
MSKFSKKSYNTPFVILMLTSLLTTHPIIGVNSEESDEDSKDFSESHDASFSDDDLCFKLIQEKASQLQGASTDETADCAQYILNLAPGLKDPEIREKAQPLLTITYQALTASLEKIMPPLFRLEGLQEKYKHLATTPPSDMPYVPYDPATARLNRSEPYVEPYTRISTTKISDSRCLGFIEWHIASLKKSTKTDHKNHYAKLLLDLIFEIQEDEILALALPSILEIRDHLANYLSNAQKDVEYLQNLEENYHLLLKTPDKASKNQGF